MSRRPARPVERQERGSAAEERAAGFLEAEGYRVLARNHRSRRGEVDLIVEKGDVIAFVEVRSRTFAGVDGPAATIGFAKRKRIVAAATDWAVRNRVLDSHGLRFDVISIVERGDGEEIEWIPGAFDASGAAT